jgi:hypothetical protein
LKVNKPKGKMQPSFFKKFVIATPSFSQPFYGELIAQEILDGTKEDLQRSIEAANATRVGDWHC